MKNQEKGFSHVAKHGLEAHEEDMLRNEFEIMQRLDFVFIKQLGARSAEEYILKITELRRNSRHPEGSEPIR